MLAVLVQPWLKRAALQLQFGALLPPEVGFRAANDIICFCYNLVLAGLFIFGGGDAECSVGHPAVL